MYRYTFSFRFQLTTKLFEKVNNILDVECKEKYDGVDRETLHCYYGDHVTANQQA